MEDPRPVVRVDWYTFKQPGFAGSVGILHSILAVMVQGGNAGMPHTYVIEKADLGPQVDLLHPDVRQRLKNGVHVSHWRDVAPNVEKDAIRTLRADQIEQGVGPDALRMRTLRELAVGLGPYNVATCNCHHAALAMYNRCAIPPAKVDGMPNSIYTIGAKVLTRLSSGVKVSRSVTTATPIFAEGGSFVSVGSVAAGPMEEDEEIMKRRPSLNSKNSGTRCASPCQEREDTGAVVEGLDHRGFLQRMSATKMVVQPASSGGDWPVEEEWDDSATDTSSYCENRRPRRRQWNSRNRNRVRKCSPQTKWVL